MPQLSPPPLIQALLQPERYAHGAEYCRLIETHISWVILTGRYAYKIKKPVDLGFLDFSTLVKRRFYCEEELRLNRRLAPGVYEAVVPISGTEEAPLMEGDGKAIEYAVKMVQFEQAAQLDRMLEQGQLEPRHMDAFCRLVADFHARAAVAEVTEDYGTPPQVWQPMGENFTQTRERIDDKHQRETLKELERWSRATFDALAPVLLQRKANGFIRECHGDMHLRNLAWIDNRPIAFDGIEFNPHLRWIDVISEVAFLVMDLQARNETGLAQRFLNGYLERTGDYFGLRLLPLYLVYRAMVRAKVCAIRLEQGQQDERSEVEAELEHYLALAKTCIRPAVPLLLITRGVSGSGKTSLSQQLLEILPAIRIRSDVERKRLYGMSALESGRAPPAEGIYSAEATRQTYDRLRQFAGEVLTAGFTVIVDATFLQRGQREPFEQLAREKGVGYAILEFSASEEALRNRVLQRRGDASDADLVVLEHQLEGYEPLLAEEEESCLKVDTETPFDPDSVVWRIKGLTAPASGS